MILLGIAFFMNIVSINLFPPTIEELVDVGWIIFGVGAFVYILSVLTLRRKGVSSIVDSGNIMIYGMPPSGWTHETGSYFMSKPRI